MQRNEFAVASIGCPWFDVQVAHFEIMAKVVIIHRLHHLVAMTL